MDLTVFVGVLSQLFFLICACFVKRDVWGVPIWSLFKRDKCVLIGCCVVLLSIHCADRPGTEEGVSTGSCLHCKQRILLLFFFIYARHCGRTVGRWSLTEESGSDFWEKLKNFIHCLATLNLTETTALGLCAGSPTGMWHLGIYWPEPELLVSQIMLKYWTVCLLVFTLNPLPRQSESSERSSLIHVSVAGSKSDNDDEEPNLMNH